MQKRKKICIHIGDAKTGTTSLQKLLNAHGKDLRRETSFMRAQGDK